MTSICISSVPQPLAATPLVLPMSEGHVRAGFPSPAEDFAVNRLDLTQILVTHPQATFLLRVAVYLTRRWRAPCKLWHRVEPQIFTVAMSVGHWRNLPKKTAVFSPLRIWRHSRRAGVSPCRVPTVT